MASVYGYEQEIWKTLKEFLEGTLDEVFETLEENPVGDGLIDMSTGKPLREIDIDRRTKARDTVHAQVSKRYKVTDE